MLTLTGLQQAPFADGVVNGVSDSDTTGWSVRIASENPFDRCSGALIAERWVLTAAHCLYLPNSRTLRDWHQFYLLLGATSIWDGRGTYRHLDEKPIEFGSKQVGGALQDDVALMHLDASAPSNLSPLPLDPPEAVVAPASMVRFTGWGPVSLPGHIGEQQRSSSTGDWTLGYGTCGEIARTVCYKMSQGARSFPGPGDSGAPVTAMVRGAYMEAGIFSGSGYDNKGKPYSTQYGAKVSNYTSLIRAFTGLRRGNSNEIVRDPATGASWLVDKDGFRHWIPTGAVYNCLVGNGVVSRDRPRYEALSIPEDTYVRATCTPKAPAPGPGPANSIFSVMNTSETPPDGVWFRNSARIADTDRVTGHGVYANDRVALQCFVRGEPVGTYRNPVWYRANNITRPTVPRTNSPNSGFLNAHYVNDGLGTDKVVAGIPAC